MDLEKKIDIWNIIISVVFLALLFCFGMKVEAKGIIVDLDVFGFVILALASFRVIRLVMYDKVFRWFRGIFEGESKTGFFATISFTLGCPWCFGIWAVFIVLILSYLVPFGEWLVLLLALSGVATVIQFFGSWMAWAAADKKKVYQKK